MNIHKRATEVIEHTLQRLGRNHEIMWSFPASETGWLTIDFWLDLTMEKDGYVLFGTEGEVRVSKEEPSPHWFTITTRPRVPLCGHRIGPLTNEDIANTVVSAVEAIDKQVTARQELLDEVVEKNKAPA